MAVLLAYSGTVTALGRQWSDSLEHGFMLAGLTVWLVWREREHLEDAVTWWPATVFVFGAALLWTVGAVAGIQAIEQLAFTAVLAFWAIGTFGIDKSKRILRWSLYLLLALPLWGLLAPVLQALTVLANTVLLSFSGVKANVQGTFIAIPEGTFEVAAGCSGISFFLSGLTVGAAYGEMIPMTMRGRLVAIALMGSLSIVANWIRVFALILIGHWTNMQSSLIADHYWFGWVLFSIVVGVFFLLSPRIESRFRLPDSPRVVPAEFTLTPALHGVARSHRGFTRVSTAAWALACISALGPVGLRFLQSIPQAPSPEGIDGLRLIGWDSLLVSDLPIRSSATTSPAHQWTPQFKGAERHQVGFWVNGRDTLRVDRLFFSGRDHQHKLIASSNSIAEEREILLDRVIGINDGSSVRTLRQAAVRVDSLTNRAILYWYRVGTTSTGVPLVAKALQVPASIMRRAPSELVAASIRCTGDCTGAYETLRQIVIGQNPTGERAVRP